jgi:hypothetical protein
MYRPQDRQTNDELALTITRCVLGAHRERQQARRTLLAALRADGYSHASARILCDRLLSEARHARKDAEIHQG